jgi:hypothetical protein
MFKNSNDDLLYLGADFRKKDHRELIDILEKTINNIAVPKSFKGPNLENEPDDPENIYLSSLQKEKQKNLWWQLLDILNLMYVPTLIKQGLSNEDSTEHLKSIWSNVYQANLTPEKQVTIINLLLNPNYEPPKKIDDVIAHLQTIQVYYSYLYYMPYAISQCIDFSCAKLLTYLSVLLCVFHDKHVFSRRISKSIEKKKFYKAQRAQNVFRAFYSIDTKGKSLNKIAADIRAYLSDYKKPSARSIKRYLIEDDDIKKYLINMGVKLGQMKHLSQ